MTKLETQKQENLNIALKAFGEVMTMLVKEPKQAVEQHEEHKGCFTAPAEPTERTYIIDEAFMANPPEPTAKQKRTSKWFKNEFNQPARINLPSISSNKPPTSGTLRHSKEVGDLPSTVLAMFGESQPKLTAVDELADPVSGSCWSGLDHLIRQGSMETRILTFYTLYGDLLQRPVSHKELAVIINYDTGSRGGYVVGNLEKAIYRLRAKGYLRPIRKVWGLSYIVRFQELDPTMINLINSKI